MGLSSVFIFLLSFLTWIGRIDSNLSFDLLQDRFVFITPPKDVTIFLVSHDKIVVAWDMLPIFVPHDVSLTPFTKLENGNSIKGLEAKIPFELVPISSNGTNTSMVTNDEDGKSDNQDTINDDDANVHTVPVTCKPATSFVNYTVLEEKDGVSKSGLPVSLIESDVSVTQGFRLINTDHNKIVKFEKGCVTKFVISYSREDDRGGVQEITKNFTDRLASIEGLKEGTNYKILVTAHFASGDALSAPRIFRMTLREGQPQICTCDWHGTTNHTSSCESPNNGDQVCTCSKGYAGRFCEVCGDGFYRDSLGHGCKECPCDELSAAKSSCGFGVEGFLHCDQCAEGYTGNVCHRCADGYFRFKNKCIPCNCNGNAAQMCNPSTGSCNCLNNTDGFYCERCKSGYKRDPSSSNGSCIQTGEMTSPSEDGHTSSSISRGVIGAIVAVVVLCLCLLIGVFICHHVRAKRRKRAFWTVEMRPDNDDLDFNSVRNEGHRMEDDEVEFHDDQGQRKTSGKYSKLREEF